MGSFHVAFGGDEQELDRSVSFGKRPKSVRRADRSTFDPEPSSVLEEPVESALTAQRVAAVGGKARAGRGSHFQRQQKAPEVVFGCFSKCRQIYDLSLALVGDRQFMTALGTARCEHAAAILGGHAAAKSVFIGAFAAAGLVSTLHRFSSVKATTVARAATNSPPVKNGSEPADKLTAYVKMICAPADSS